MKPELIVSELKARHCFTRRKLFQYGLPLVAGSLAAPAIVRNAFASSGELNLMMWPGYLSEKLLAEFTAETGIKVNLEEVAANKDILSRVQKKEGAYDLICPTHNRSLAWAETDLLQAFDLNQVATSALIKPFVGFAETAWNFKEAGAHWLPLVWGAEGMAWRTDKWEPKEGNPSYGDLWSKENEGASMGRPFSMMTAAGLAMEANGDLEVGSVWNSYADEETMRKTWRLITDWCIANKKPEQGFWKTAEDQFEGLLGDVTIAQTWDAPALGLRSAGEAVAFKAPKEGALVWSDGLAMPKSAVNSEQAYALIKFLFATERAEQSLADHGYNSAVMNAAPQDSDVYTTTDLDNLQVWPATPSWYSSARSEFVNEFVKA